MRELKLAGLSAVPLPAVAPSRVRELKHAIIDISNSDICRTFTGAWIETDKDVEYPVITMSHLHGCVNWNNVFWSKLFAQQVAPSRVRELKPINPPVPLSAFCRTFTGAWIET